MRIGLLALAFWSVGALAAADKSLHLEIGDPARRDREAPLVLDGITDTSTGELITPRELASRLPQSGLVFLGESHTSMEFHNVQRRVIEELLRIGRKVIIGLEMYPYTEQKHLDSWTQGLYTEEGFVQLSRWYENWGYHWNYYRDIFLLARDRGLRMFAVNTPREVVSAVRKKGFTNLTPEEAAHIPEKIDTTNQEHLTLFKSFFEGTSGMHSSMDEAAWKAMFDAQCAWDATMGFNSVRALKEHGDSSTVMVVLIGSGHVAYDLGIQRQSAQWYEGPMASVIPIPVRNEDNEAVETVRASYARFLWGLPREQEPLYPELGISTTEASAEPRRRVINVAGKSPARDAGLKAGDILLSMDGREIRTRDSLNMQMAGKRWRDSARIVVRRGDEEVSLTVFFRRKPLTTK